MTVSKDTYDSLVDYTSQLNEIKQGKGADEVGLHNLLQMIASTVDYQFA